MTLFSFLLLLLVAAVCGAVGQTFAGIPRGGCLMNLGGGSRDRAKRARRRHYRPRGGFFLVEPTSLPLSVGILTGLMWIPLSPMIGHWIGLAHGLGRTALVTAAWYAFPGSRFVAVPAVIVAVYLFSIGALAARERG